MTPIPESAPESVDSGLSHRSASGVAAASLVAALSNFVIMFIATRTLPAAAGTEFLAFWSLLTGMFGVVSGVQNETTRAVGAVLGGRSPGVRALAPAMITGVIVAAIVLILSPLIAHRIVPLSASITLPTLVITTIVYAAYVTLVGSFGGHGWWTQYASLLCSEVVLRMLLMGTVLVMGAYLGGYVLACSCATAILFVFLGLSRRARQAFASRADAGLGEMVRKNLLAVLSTSCTAILITAYGAILKGVAHNTDPLLLGGLILAVSLTRAPIMIPLTAFTGVAIKIFLGHREAPLRAVLKPIAALLALGLVGGAAAWLVGPWFVPLFNPDYHIAGWVFGFLTFSSAFMAILTLLGTLVLALDAHVIYALGWLIASAVAIAILLSGISLSLRVVLSLGFGPIVGGTVMVVWLASYAHAVKVAPQAS